MLLLDIVCQGPETDNIIPSQTVIVGDDFLLDFNGGQAPVHAKVNWDKDEGMVENVHLLGPPFDTYMPSILQLRVEKC